MSEKDNLNLDGEEENNSSEENQTGLEIPTSIVYEGDTNRSIRTEMETCYLDYAMSVIVSRALPDIRDGFKPVHRRILFSMHEQGLRSSAKFRKSATVVGHVLGNYHPHGDSSVYEAMVRMAQDFSLRYPLVHGQGNFGSMDGDSAAAYRYTEAKMTKLAEFMLADIEKETVDFRDNFDTTKQEPTVMPTRIPNLLMNGVMGIAVGMATNIPPHNLTELLNAIEFLLKSDDVEEITVEDLMQYVTGPDFPTGGIIYDREAILTAYSTGRGSIPVRGVAKIEENKKGRSVINISEIPYGLNKSSFVEKIADLVRDKKVVGISDLRDESNKDSVRIIIEIKKDAFPKKILNQLYKLTPLQTSFGFNMISLGERGRQPRLYNLKDFLVAFIEHRKEVVTRRTIYELKIAEARAHILEGLKIALDNIDEVIKTIRAAYDDAEVQLMNRFNLSKIQAEAIVEMKLRRLQGLEKEKIENELAEKLALIMDLNDILIKPERIVSIILEELTEIREKFGDERRTQVNAGKIGEFNPKDTIPNEEVFVVLSKNSYIKRLKADSFRTQRRGGKGVTTGAKEDDEIKLIIPTQNHSDLLYFTSKGRVFTLPAYEIPETNRIAKGQPVINFIALQKDEEIAAIMDISKDKSKYLFFVTKGGTVKKLDMQEVKNIRSNGLRVLGVKEDDELSWVKTTGGDDSIFIATREGKAIQFDEEDVRPMGRNASGVRGILIKGEDQVIEVAIVGADKEYVFIVTENGMGKLSSIDEYRNQKRGGSGVKAMSVTAKTGKLISATMLSEEDRKTSDVILISKGGQTIRLNIKGIRPTSRVTQGVILTKLKDGDDSVVRASIVKEGEEEVDE
ncbi:MAG: DNA gyrase subunit A [Candidatus Gracilibacteria bacterium]|nr:DNA gyrase subunit A [Candidatus Gracilibacteria bacterium]